MIGERLLLRCERADCDGDVCCIVCTLGCGTAVNLVYLGVIVAPSNTMYAALLSIVSHCSTAQHTTQKDSEHRQLTNRASSDLDGQVRVMRVADVVGR